MRYVHSHILYQNFNETIGVWFYVNVLSRVRLFRYSLYSMVQQRQKSGIEIIKIDHYFWNKYQYVCALQIFPISVLKSLCKKHRKMNHSWKELKKLKMQDSNVNCSWKTFSTAFDGQFLNFVIKKIKKWTLFCLT